MRLALIRLRRIWAIGMGYRGRIHLFSVAGNPDLEPEPARSWEVGVTQLFWESGGSASYTWFDSEYRNGIDFDPGPPPRLVNRNVIDTHGYEVELSAKSDSGWEVRSALTRLTARTAETDEQLRSRPKWSAATSVGCQILDGMSASVVARYVGEVNDSSVPTGAISLSPWGLVDGAWRWQIAEGAEVWMVVENLLDKSHEQAVGFSAPGIRPRLGMSFRI